MAYYDYFCHERKDPSNRQCILWASRENSSANVWQSPPIGCTTSPQSAVPLLFSRRSIVAGT
eukprot:489972-Pleurochrysis_carterae.AAC.1